MSKIIQKKIDNFLEKQGGIHRVPLVSRKVPSAIIQKPVKKGGKGSGRKKDDIGQFHFAHRLDPRTGQIIVSERKPKYRAGVEVTRIPMLEKSKVVKSIDTFLDKQYCETPGRKIRSQGMGRGLGIGRGHGPIKRNLAQKGINKK